MQDSPSGSQTIPDARMQKHEAFLRGGHPTQEDHELCSALYEELVKENPTYTVGDIMSLKVARVQAWYRKQMRAKAEQASEGQTVPARAGASSMSKNTTLTPKFATPKTFPSSGVFGMAKQGMTYPTAAVNKQQSSMATQKMSSQDGFTVQMVGPDVVQARLHEQELVIVELRETVLLQKQKIDQLTVDNAQMSNGGEQLQKEMAVLRALVQAQKEKNERLAADNLQASKAIEEMRAELVALRTEHGKLKTVCAEKTLSLEVAQTKCLETMGQISELDENFRALAAQSNANKRLLKNSVKMGVLARCAITDDFPELKAARDWILDVLRDGIDAYGQANKVAVEALIWDQIQWDAYQGIETPFDEDAEVTPGILNPLSIPDAVDRTSMQNILKQSGVECHQLIGIVPIMATCWYRLHGAKGMNDWLDSFGKNGTFRAQFNDAFVEAHRETVALIEKGPSPP